MLSLGATVRGLGVITSRIFMGLPPDRWRSKRLARERDTQASRIIDCVSRITGRVSVWLSLAAALVVFAVVQDRVTAAGAREYVVRQREALAGRGDVPTI